MSETANARTYGLIPIVDGPWKGGQIDKFYVVTLANLKCSTFRHGDDFLGNR